MYISKIKMSHTIFFSSFFFIMIIVIFFFFLLNNYNPEALPDSLDFLLHSLIGSAGPVVAPGDAASLLQSYRPTSAW